MGDNSKLAVILGYLMKAVQAAPDAIKLVEAIHGESKDGATKTRLASDAALAATGVFDEIDPSDTATANAVNSSVQSIVAALAAAK